MESKRKNVYITIFVITTIVAATLAVYFGLEYKKLKENNLKQYLSADENNQNKGEVTVKEVEKIVEKETQLSQENIDKIAQSTIENYLNLEATITAEPLNALVKLGFYSDYTELIKNLKNDNGVEISTVKYEDFVNKITKYMTKELFENSYVKTNVYKNVNGYLARYVGGASGYFVHVRDIKLQNKNVNEFTYSVNYKIFSGFDTISSKDETETLTIKKVNEDYVISAVV